MNTVHHLTNMFLCTAEVVGSNVSVEEKPSTTPKIETTTETETSIDQTIVGFEVSGYGDETREHL